MAISPTDRVGRPFAFAQPRLRRVLDQQKLALHRPLTPTFCLLVKPEVGGCAAPGGQRQAIAVARAAMWELAHRHPRRADRGTRRRAEGVGARPRQGLAPKGFAVFIVSHDLVDVFAVATRITLLVWARSVGIFERDHTTQDEIVHAITFGTEEIAP
jgi:D-xylose transport system ATP-binding protein